MNKFILAVIVMAVSSSSFATDLIIGGWSSHGSQSEYEKLNESHYTFGAVFDNGVTVFTLRNSFNRQAGMAGYTKNISQWNYGKYKISTSLVIGVITGYTKEQAPNIHLRGNLSAYLLPVLSFGYGRVTLDTGISVAFNKPLITTNFRFTL